MTEENFYQWLHREINNKNDEIEKLNQKINWFERKHERDTNDMWEMITMMSAKIKDLEDKTGFRIDREDIKKRLEEQKNGSSN